MHIFQYPLNRIHCLHMRWVNFCLETVKTLHMQQEVSDWFDVRHSCVFVSYWSFMFDLKSVKMNTCNSVPQCQGYDIRTKALMWNDISHYNDVIMTTMAYQITSPTVVYSIVYPDADQRKHQSSASLAFVWGIHRDRWIPCTNGQLCGKCFNLMTSSCRLLASHWIWHCCDKINIVLSQISLEFAYFVLLYSKSQLESYVRYVEYPSVLKGQCNHYYVTMTPNHARWCMDSNYGMDK